MNIFCGEIPHSDQEYPTCGNWKFYDRNLVITVSKLSDWRYVVLVALHEQIEAMLCKHRGIEEQAVTDWDIAYEALRPDGDNSEPGDDPDSPYREEHKFATQVERMMAEELGVQWEEYEKAIYALG